jgi:hypothetical protein
LTRCLSAPIKEQKTQHFPSNIPERTLLRKVNNGSEQLYFSKPCPFSKARNRQIQKTPKTIVQIKKIQTLDKFGGF